MSTPKDKGIILCASCSKPIVGEATIVKALVGATKTWYYHPTPTDCSNAESLKKNWRKHDREKGETHNGTEAGLHEGYGHKRKFDYSLSVWFRDLEPENNLR